MHKLLSLALALGLFSGARAQTDSDGWEALFDGDSLTGWKLLNGKATYEVKDGTILGKTVAGSPNSFLATVEEFGDFELEFEVKVDDNLNSGVQIRSRVVSEEDLAAHGAGKKKPALGRFFGPQVEIEAGPGQAGWIYGEATGRGWISPEPGNKDKKVSQHSHFRNGEWNHYRVVAEGSRIRTWINGAPVADLTDESLFKTHPQGKIALQVHSIGKNTGPFQVAWRNIRIKRHQGG